MSKSIVEQKMDKTQCLFIYLWFEFNQFNDKNQPHEYNFKRAEYLPDDIDKLNQSSNLFCKLEATSLLLWLVEGC